MGSTPTSGSAEDLSQYDPGCWTGCKTLTLTFTKVKQVLNYTSSAHFDPEISDVAAQNLSPVRAPTFDREDADILPAP